MTPPKLEVSEEIRAKVFDMAGLRELSENEQEAELAMIGTLLVERAFTSFILGLEESRHAGLEAFVSLYAEADDFIERLCRAYPEFTAALESEGNRYRLALEQTFGADV